MEDLKVKINLIILFSIMCLIILIPQSFAGDNQTAFENNTTEKTTDYYFDVNADSDGNGTEFNPYNNFTNDRIKDNSTIHLAGGEYSFSSQSRLFSNISFYGTNPHDTILNGNGTSLTINGLINFKNITLTNFNIINQGTLNASNTFFTKLISSYPPNDGINDFGGAIYAMDNKNIYLDNCKFFNNSAQYGGAIYARGGNLTILNSVFYNNTAYNFGGAILAENRVKIIINNTRFIREVSVDDGGGAIYLISSFLKAFNLTVANCSSTYGSAITALKCDMDLTGSTFTGNIAKYDGGAIYQLYGSLILNSSRFISNTAENGAGLFINDVDVINVTSNEFINNTAIEYGGAVYSFLMNVFNFTDNTFENNSAYQFVNVYNKTKVNLTIGNGNYTIYTLNQTFNSTIPSSYDLRDYGWVSPVKDQLKGGNCWAFAALAALESCILKVSGEVFDFSEENIKNLMAMYSDYGRKFYNTNDGGNEDMAIAYLTSWLGPVSEDDDTYDDMSHLSPILDSMMHVQNIVLLKRNNFTDNDEIKQAILNYGAVATLMYYDVGIYDGKIYHYYDGNSAPNHAVTIVGWDDSISVPKAPGKGAWIVKNSWGSNWPASYSGDGYFYVSYYDTVFANPGSYSSYTFILNDTKHFDKNYQYDISGVTDYFYVGQSTIWYKNTFNASDNEFLSAVSTYFNEKTEWELFIYVNGNMQLMQNGSSIPGYYTINLNYPLPLKKGDHFEILFKITVDGDVGFPISEIYSVTKLSYEPQISFVSLNGDYYYDLYDLSHTYPNHSYASQVACIKGFTQLITLNSTFEPVNITYDSLNMYNVTLNLLDEINNLVRNGEVTFNVNGENYTVEVYNGVAFLQIPFVLGLNNISWIFNSPNYSSCSGNTTFEVLPVIVDLNIDVVQVFNNTYISFTCSQPLNENLTVGVNGVNQVLKIINGTAYLNLTSLEYGQYNITACVDNEFYVCQNSTDFFVNVKRTYFKISNLTAVYNTSVFYQVQILDQFNLPLTDVQIRYMLNNDTFYNVTDSSGYVYVPLELPIGNYTIDVYFEGDGCHVKSQNSSNITINPIKTTLNISSIVYDSFDLFNISVKVFDEFKNLVNHGIVTFNVNGVDFEVNVNEGDVILKTALLLGINNISAKFNDFDYYESAQSTTFEVLPVYLDLNIDMVQVFNNAYISFTCSQPLNENLTVGVNGVNQVLKIINGTAYLNLTSLEYGQYNITACVDNEFYDCQNSTDFFVNVKRTYVNVSDLETVYNSGVYYPVQLLDQFNMPVSGREIKFAIDDNVYYNLTDENGIALVVISLKVDVYSSIISFEGDDLYIASQNHSKVSVKSSIALPTSMDYALNSDYEVYLLDKFSNPLNNTLITFNIDNKNYDVLSDNQGRATLSIPVKSGNFIVNLTNPSTGEKSSQNITVFKRITQNNDIFCYYGKNPNFKVCVCDDNGLFREGLVVKITFNKKTYNVLTDKYGWASLKISSKSGKYTIVSEYKGYNVSNKITIKPTLITKNKKVKKGKTIKYTAKLLNKNGKILKNKKITFKIKGKIYTAKTNKKGIATVKIKNLKVGKYKITVKYAKQTSKSTITVKK